MIGVEKMMDLNSQCGAVCQKYGERVAFSPNRKRSDLCTLTAICLLAVLITSNCFCQNNLPPYGTNRSEIKTIRPKTPPLQNYVLVYFQDHTRKTHLSATFLAMGQFPREMAIIVKIPTTKEINFHARSNRDKSRTFDNELYAQANWMPFRTNCPVDLGPGDGWRFVWFGFKWATNHTFWSLERVLVDNISPCVAITNPPTLLVDQPILQLQGFSDESIQKIRYTLVNPAGEVQEGEGYVNDRHLDSGTFRYTTTTFSCYDLTLSPGENKFNLRCEDAVGNSFETNIVYVLSYANKKPPILSLIWPQDQMLIASGKVTVRGMSDDASMRIGGVISHGENRVEFIGVVERNGKFWLDNLPLGPGANLIEIVARDAAGNTSQTNITVIRSPEELNVDPLPTNFWRAGFVDVSGRISDPEMAVWVNGIQAAVRPDGTWLAKKVPVPQDDPNTFSFFIIANPPDKSPDPAKGKKNIQEKAIVIGNYGSDGVQFNCQRPINGTLEIHLVGTVGKSFVLQASTNLVDWVPLATNYNSGPAYNYVDSDVGNYPCRFYRAVPIR